MELALLPGGYKLAIRADRPRSADHFLVDLRAAAGALGSAGSGQKALGQEARLPWGVRGLYSVVRVEVRTDPRNQHRTAWGPHHTNIREDRQLWYEEQPLVYPIRRWSGATFGAASMEAGNRDDGG